MSVSSIPERYRATYAELQRRVNLYGDMQVLSGKTVLRVLEELGAAELRECCKQK